MKYNIQQKIETLAQNAVMEKAEPPSFIAEDITFLHWEFNINEGWLQDAWIAQADIESTNFKEAYRIFSRKLARVIPRVALISQSYIEYLNQPFLIHKESTDLAFFRYVVDRKGVGLMFMQQEKKALDLLLENKAIPESFYYYWNDAVNAYGYPPKLLLMFCAIAALAKKPNGKTDYDLIEKILGKELKDKIYAPNKGLRHRLVHGDYFIPEDANNNYLELVHKKVVSYFNSEIFKEALLEENVAHPQRHFFGNKNELNKFIRSNGLTTEIELKTLLDDFNKNGFNNLQKYEFVFDDSLNSSY